MIHRKEVVASPSMHNVLSAGTVLTGNLVSDEDIRIDGIIEGNILSKGKIIIGNNGNVSGDIECTSLDLMGKVTGNILCRETVVLRGSATVSGDIKTRIIEVEHGAQFFGSCSMLKEND